MWQAHNILAVAVLCFSQRAQAAVFCNGVPDPIRLGNEAVETYFCPTPSDTNRFLFLWETVNTSTEGLSDDEYYVHLLNDGVKLYSSEQQFDASEGSVEITTPESGSSFQVQVECNLEAFFRNCEDGTFAFSLVQCGCPEGNNMIKECEGDSVDTASDAVCEARSDLGSSPPHIEIPLPPQPAPVVMTTQPSMTPAEQPSVHLPQPTSSLNSAVVVGSAIGGALLVLSVVACVVVVWCCCMRRQDGGKVKGDPTTSDSVMDPVMAVEAQVLPVQVIEARAEPVVTYPYFKDQVRPATNNIVRTGSSDCSSKI